MSLEPLGRPRGPSYIPVSPWMSLCPLTCPRACRRWTSGWRPTWAPCSVSRRSWAARGGWADAGGGWWQGRGLQGDPVSPHEHPHSLVNELAFTARKMMAPEAHSSGLVRYCGPPPLPGGDPVPEAVPGSPGGAPSVVPVPAGSPSRPQPGVPRQGDAAAGSPGRGHRHRGPQPRGRAGHQGEPGLLAGPPRLREPPLRGERPPPRNAGAPPPQNAVLPVPETPGTASSLFPLPDHDDVPISMLWSSPRPSLSLGASCPRPLSPRRSVPVPEGIPSPSPRCPCPCARPRGCPVPVPVPIPVPALVPRPPGT